MADALTLAIDVGTGSMRAALVDGAGIILAIASREHEQIVPRYGWAEQRPADWWAGVAGAAREVLAAVPGARERIEVIAACGQMHGTVLVDADGALTRQPVACPACGPDYVLEEPGRPRVRGDAAIARCAVLLGTGAVVALKGIGGYHLACNARDGAAVAALRERKFRKERPFALMVRDMATARDIVALDDAAEALLASSARPIVLGPARIAPEGVAPANCELGVMLPYAPIHYLLFAAGAPPALVVTSAESLERTDRVR